MLKSLLQRGARALGLNLVNIGRFGVDLELDLARFTAKHPLRTIFDVGGNFGQTALRFAAAFPASTVFTFEPVPTSFARLARATANHGRIRAFPTALGDEPGHVAINVTDNAASHTLLANPTTTSSVDVPVETLDAFTATHGVETIDLLKLDVEGYELQVLRGARRLLDTGRVHYVFAECVLAADPELPHTGFLDLHRVLEGHGFSFVNYYGESFRLRTGCALGNALYALRSQLPTEVPGRVANIT